MRTRSLKAAISSLCLSVLLAQIASGHALAATTTKDKDIGVEKILCPDADLWGTKLITGVCWSCLFPIRLGGFTLFGDTDDLPEGVTNRLLCACDANGIPAIGITGGAWLPSRMVEVVRKPYCSPALGGITFNPGVRLYGGHKETEGDGADKTFYNYHFWAFPLFLMLQLFVQNNCNAGGLRNMDMMYMSELDPTWNIDELAFFLNPESVLFSNPLALAACAVDCAVTTAHKPIDKLFWCAGCWGNLYPFSGGIASEASPPRDTSLLTARVLSSLHRKGLAHKTYGNGALCSGQLFPMVPKQQYKMSMLFPLAEADNGERIVRSEDPATGKIIEKKVPDLTDGCCHWIGESPFKWGEWRTVPAAGEDYLYLIWRYSECCLNGNGQ